MIRLAAILLVAWTGCSESDMGADGGVAAGDGAILGDCSDVESDPLNCGECGRVCVIPGAHAGCVAGECVIDRCEVGLADLDGELANGCEAVGSCEQESCNAVDDDCDGECDEGGMAGCRTGVHRANGNGHIYTGDLAMASSTPFSLERENYFYLYSGAADGLGPVHLCLKNNGRYFVTGSAACEGAGSVVSVLGHWSGSETCGATPLYRTYNGGSGNHFYTTSAPERDNAVANLGYIDEGIAGYVWQAP